MESLAAALAETRSKSGLSHRELGEKLGLHRVTVIGREAGRKDMPASGLVDVARATGCSIVATPDGWEVLDPPDPMPLNPERTDRHLVEQPGDGLPVWGRAGAGPPVLGADQAEEWFDLRRRWLNRLDGVLEVHGDSMQPLLQEGDLLGLRALALDELPEIGEVCVVWLPNLGEVVVKIYAGCRQREVALLSSNLEYPPMFLPLDQAVPRARVTSILRSAALRIRLEEWEYWPGPRG